MYCLIVLPFFLQYLTNVKINVYIYTRHIICGRIKLLFRALGEYLTRCSGPQTETKISRVVISFCNLLHCTFFFALCSPLPMRNFVIYEDDLLIDRVLEIL
jgi:hypothetical protein